GARDGEAALERLPQQIERDVVASEAVGAGVDVERSEGAADGDLAAQRGAPRAPDDVDGAVEAQARDAAQRRRALRVERVAVVGAHEQEQLGTGGGDVAARGVAGGDRELRGADDELRRVIARVRAALDDEIAARADAAGEVERDLSSLEPAGAGRDERA